MAEDTIQQLKAAATERNWALFQEALRTLVCAIPHDALLNLPLPYIRTFMDDFVARNPQHRDAYDALPPADASHYLRGVTAILEQHKGEPGVNNERRAVAKLQELAGLTHCDGDYVDTFVTVVSNALLTIPFLHWGVENPELYDRWIHGTSNADLLILAKHMNKDPAYIQHERTLLLQFADDIAAQLKADS